MTISFHYHRYALIEARHLLALSFYELLMLRVIITNDAEVMQLRQPLPNGPIIIINCVGIGPNFARQLHVASRFDTACAD